MSKAKQIMQESLARLREADSDISEAEELLSVLRETNDPKAAELSTALTQARRNRDSLQVAIQRRLGGSGA